MSSPALAPAATDNTALLLKMNGEIAKLMERTENMQGDIAELKIDLRNHREANESTISKTRETLSFFRGEWKLLLLAGGLVLEHFWNALTKHS